MSADPKAIQELFAQAIAISNPAERQTFVAERCAGNPELLERIARLLAAYDAPKGLLDQPTNGMTAHKQATSSTQQPGQVIARRYKLLEEIGEGGMGTVWVAEQTQPIKRKVALKLVKPGMDSKQVLARFDAERQALAVMDHPNIAKVFDGGMTEEGRPFFAMEYVKGMPLTEYCDQLRLSVEDRLKLFVPICQAVQHAHQKGIIHRDLKPSNVLICLYDGKPVPKVIDFGLAKAMHQPLTEQTVHTGHGLMIGTPLYMSPEQAEHNNLDVDTRTDVYSLGVMLYELLTGSTPLEKAQFKDAAIGEILRLIKEVEPPKPSTRLSASVKLQNIAAQRNLDPTLLSRSIRGDLDWIVMKAIEKERARRYETANELARDIDRFLNMEAVEACPPSASYRLRRLARKHRTALMSAGAFAAILILGAGLSVWQAVRATNARKAEQLAKLAEEEQRKLAEGQRDDARRLQSEATNKSTQLLKLSEEQRRVIYASEMSQIRVESQRGNVARIREILLGHLPIDGKPDLRGFEWNYWYRHVNQADVLMSFARLRTDQDEVLALIRGDFVSVTRGQNTERYEISTGKLVGTVPKTMRGGLTALAPNGRTVNGAIFRWTFSNPSQKPVVEKAFTVWDPNGDTWTFEYPPGSFSNINFLNISPDGTLVAALGTDISHEQGKPACRLLVWDVRSHELVLNHLERRELNAFYFSPDSKSVFAYVTYGSNRNSDEVREAAVVLDTESGKTRAVLRHNDDIERAWWMPEGNRLLLSTLGSSGAQRRQLLSWSPGEDAASILSQDAVQNPLGSVSPDGRTFALTSTDGGSVRLLDTETGEVVKVLYHDGNRITSLSFSNDGSRVLASSSGQGIVSWQLDRNDDLFALRTKPLPRLAPHGYLLSNDQSLLALSLADGTLLIRRRNGEEFKLRDGIAGSPPEFVGMRFSPDNRFLAYRTIFGPDGEQPKGGMPSFRDGGILDLFDISQKRRLWSRRWQGARAGAGFVLEPQNERFADFDFSGDGNTLVARETFQLTVLDAKTGDGKAYGGLYTRPTRDPATGELFSLRGGSVITGSRSFVFNPVNGLETPIAIDESQDNRRSGPRTLSALSPNGRFVVSLPSRSAVEILDLETGQRLVTTVGVDFPRVIFSPNSSRLAVCRMDNRLRVVGISLWDPTRQRMLCELPIGGEYPDEAKFSFDGSRLLTLHGKADPYGARPPRGRLWEVESGRELLDIPVTDISNLNWDIAFDRSGNELLMLVFNKAAGISRATATALYDARPLEKSIDEELCADRLLKQLQESLPLKSEWTEKVESISGLDEAIRLATLKKIRDAEESPEKLAELIGNVVGLDTSSAEEYRRALVWAEALRRIEPRSLRSRVMLGIACMRTGRREEALRLLTSSTPDDPAGNPAITDDYELLRQATLVHLNSAMGVGNSATNDIPAPLSLSLRSVGTGWGIRFIASANQKRLFGAGRTSRAELLVRSVEKEYGDSISLEEPPSAHFRRLVRYDQNGDKQLDREELLEAMNDTIRLKDLFRVDGFKSDKAFAARLDRTIQEAPRYLTARFVRAWILATSTDASVRDGDKAIEQAELICQETSYRDPLYLEALAAAHAELGNFGKAVEWQTKALDLWKSEKLDRAYISEHLETSESHLKSYESKHAARSDSVPYLGELLARRSKPLPAKVYAALLDPQAVLRSRRISGWGGAWSPGGNQIVRHLSAEDPDAPLEIIDLETGETRQLCRGGFDPVWTATPASRIYFTRNADAASGDQVKQELWQCDASGENLRKVADGGSPSLGQDGQVYFWQFDKAGALLRSLHIDKTAAGLASEPAPEFSKFSAQGLVSPSGKLVASTDGGSLRITDIATRKEIRLIELPFAPARLRANTQVGIGAWSPDSRYFVQSVANFSFNGLLLVDVTTGEERQLADGDLNRPRWSPDGRYIAADLVVNNQLGKKWVSKNQIVILDLSSLSLDKGLGNEAGQ